LLLRTIGFLKVTPNKESNHAASHYRVSEIATTLD
jgi:hypothetical protein